jgi:transglutaminase-like putative cysteine protease
VSDGRYLYVMLRPRAMPRNMKYYYALNLMNSSSNLYYSIAWTNSGNYVNEFNTADNSWVRSFVPGTMRSAQGGVFEARVPLKALKHLPEYYHISPITWDKAYNAYNNIWTYTPETALPQKYRNYALELFARYAEYTYLVPDNPLPIAQALADAYIYRMGEDSVRGLVVSDGLLMLEEAQKTESYSFPDQNTLSKLKLDQIIAWSNRTSLYSVQGSSWKFREILSKNGEKFTAELYSFLFLDPAVFDDARAVISAYDLVVPADLPATLWKMEDTLANTQRYRGSLDFLKRLADLIGTDYWRKIYEDAKFEEENNLNIITEVAGVPIYTSGNYSATFQVQYFNDNGHHYGDCGDVTVMSVALAKVLGIPALHIHYDLIDDNYQEVIHSFPAYYSSAEDRYMGFRTGYNIVWDWAKSERETLKVHYFFDLPVDEWFSQFYSRPLPGTKVWSASNQQAAIVSLEEWESFNSGGFTAP